MDVNKVSIIIPALNERESIKKVVISLVKKFSEAEIIVIDDGSIDNTGSLAIEAGARVIKHDKTYGYGASIRTGTLASNREYVLFCDADGQHLADDVEHLIKEIDDYDMVVGVRGKTSHVPILRAPGKLALKLFANFLAGERIPDLNSGLRIIKKEILKKYMHLMPRGFSFSTTSTFALLKGNYRIKWVPITVRKREGKSSVRQWKHGPQILMLMLRLSILFEPLKIFLIISAVLLLSTITSFIIDILSAKETGISDGTVTLSIATLLVFLFGLLCDQVSALRREIHE